MSEIQIALLGIAALFLLLLLSMPVGFAMTLVGLVGFAVVVNPHAALAVLAADYYDVFSSYGLTVIPLFVFMGQVAFHTGISKKLFAAANAWLGWLRGGLAIVAIVASMFFAAISGSGPATVAAIGGLTIPTMLKQGYDPGYSGAISAAAGSIGVVIPPSIPMVSYSIATSASVGALFLGGITPGIIIGLSLMLYTRFYCKKRGYINRESLPFSWKTVGHALADGIWALLVPVIILGGIYGGIFTPTEAAAVAVAYGFIVGILIYRDLKPKDLFRIFSNAALTTATIMIILGCANTFGRILTLQRIPTIIANWFQSVTNSGAVTLMLINVLLLIVGCFMETNAAIIILAPILWPVVEAYGVNIVHFGIIMVINLAIGFITPPLGVNLFVAVNVTGSKLGTICKAIVPIIIVMVIDLLIFTYIEPTVMWLPAAAGYA